MEHGSRPQPTPVEPIAVVSVGCRLPGGIRNLAALREVLHRGEPVLQPVPADRWSPEASGGELVGSFLPDIRRFDAEYFGISPREAREIDPQQRILLEVAAEALESGGRSRQDWAGTRTGVFAGVLASDYLLLHSKTRGADKIDPFYATGKEFSFGAGRVAYSFDLHGPALTVTTACSSSLLAVHLACQSLRAGECDAALAGGVNILLAPELSMFMSRVGALSPRGQSVPFSAEADGVVRGEGCALVLLERLADAERAGHQVLAVIEGSAVNHDGHSAGLTVPSTEAQVRLLKDALAAAGIEPAGVDFVEAHATGTPLGDPIELAALAEVFGGDRPDPLLVGSHKAVFGHLDSAAGILGLLKGICVVTDGLVPPQPPLAELTPRFDWAPAGVRVATEPARLPARADGPRRVGVSAFGLSGTNAHVLLSAPRSGWLLAFTDALPAEPVRETDATFARVIERCAAAFAGEATWSLAELLDAPGALRADLRPPCAFAVQLAAAEALRARGAAPARVVGTGTGALTAAVYEGSLDLTTAARLVLCRAGLAGRAPDRGRLAELLGADRAADWAGLLAEPDAGSAAAHELIERGGMSALVEAGTRTGLAEHAPAGTPRYALAGGEPLAVVAGRLWPGAAEPRAWGGAEYWLAGVRPGEQGAAVAPAVGAPAAVEPAVGGTPAIAEPLAVAERSAVAAPAGAEPVAAPVDLAGVRARVEAAVRQVLGLDDTAPVLAQRPLLDQGLTSITVVELAVALAADFGTPEEPTLVYLCPNVDALVEHFAAVAEPAVAEPVAAGPTVAGPAVAASTPAEPVAEPAPAAAESAVAAAESAPPVPPAGPADDDVLAIVGMACRLPGAASVEEFWNLLIDGTVRVAELPEHRRERDGWREVAGSNVPTRAGYLDSIEGFDAGFFTISPMEAERIDPQQRLFLEVAVEALADAGLPTGSPVGRRTGVYVGMNTTDYQQRLTRAQADVDVYYGTGNCFAGTAGRLAYALNLGGPCLAVDTACSSSLTALHLARQALRAGDCDAAVVGGVNVISGPTVSVSMSRGGALAPDGWCKTFAATADGYGRGEGAGVIVLKRLSDALRDGDRIHATVLGSAINSDGASGGFTVPNAAAQTAVVTAALSAARLDPAAVGYVEAHGTGTPLGDPIELQALSAALGSAGRPGGGPYVGSVKSLVGHLEAAAGITGLIKAALAVRNGSIPPHVLPGEPTGKVDWARIGLRLPPAGAGWPAGRDRVAGISAFGFTGSNAHVIVGQPPASRQPERSEPADELALLVSAESPAALRARAGQLRAAIETGADLPDLAYTLGRRSSSYRWRAVVLAADRQAAVAALGALAEDREHPALVTGAHPATEPATVELRFGLGGYLGPDWAYLPDELRLAANEAAAGVDRAQPGLGQELSTTQRQRLISLRAQLGWAAAWRALGVRIAGLAGAGVGAQTAALLGGELELTDALRRTLGAAGDETCQCPPPAGDGVVALDAVPCGVTTFAAWQHVRARLHVLGYPVDWAGLVPGRGRLLSLPGYPWQRRDYWFTPSAPVTSAPVTAAPVTAAGTEPAPSGLLFEHAWQPAEPGGAEATGTWVLFADPAGPDADGVAGALRAAGAEVVSVPVPGLDPAAWLPSLGGVGGPVAGTVLVAAGQPAAAGLTLAFGQAVQRFAGKLGGAHLITRGAQGADMDGASALPGQAAAWAVGAVLATELGRRWGRLVDLAAASPDAALPDGLAAVLAAGPDDQVRHTSAGWQARRLRTYRPVAGGAGEQSGEQSGELTGKPSGELTGSHAVYAGDPATVLPVLRWLAGRGAEHVLLHAPGTDDLSDDLGLRVEQPADRDGWLSRLGELAQAGALTGLCLGPPAPAEPVTVRDADAGAVTTDDELLAATAELLGERAPRLVLGLVDAAGDWGALGAAATGARNAASRTMLRSAFGDRARVLGLLPLADEIAPSAAAENAAHTETSLQAESGIGRLTAEQLAGVLDLVVAAPAGAELTAGVVEVDRYVAVCQRLAPRTLLSELGTGAEAGGTALQAELAGLPADRRAERVLELVLTATGTALGLATHEVNPDTGFFDLGMDSIIALALKTQLENETGTELPATLTFELPTPRKLARHLTGLLEPGTQPDEHNQPAQHDQTPNEPAFSWPETATEGTPDSDVTEATDDELLRLLAAATASARDLLQEASRW